MFPDSFQQQMIELNGIELCVTSGGEGPPLILLHGFPHSHSERYLMNRMDH